MKLVENIIKAAAAVAVVAGIAYLIVKYLDAIKAWLEKLCPCCQIEEEDFETEETAAEAPAEEAAPAEETAPVEEVAPVQDDVPVADEADFEA